MTSTNQEAPVTESETGVGETAPDSASADNGNGEEVEVELVETNFYYPQHTDPRRLVPGGSGVYLDDVQRMQAEAMRAKSEGREPDYENAPVTAGQPLYSEANYFPDGYKPAALGPDLVAEVPVGENPPDDELKKAKDATLEAVQRAQEALKLVETKAQSVPVDDSAKSKAPQVEGEAAEAQVSANVEVSNELALGYAGVEGTTGGSAVEDLADDVDADESESSDTDDNGTDSPVGDSPSSSNYSSGY